MQNFYTTFICKEKKIWTLILIIKFIFGNNSGKATAFNFSVACPIHF